MEFLGPSRSETGQTGCQISTTWVYLVPTFGPKLTGLGWIGIRVTTTLGRGGGRVVQFEIYKVVGGPSVFAGIFLFWAWGKLQGVRFTLALTSVL